MAAWPTAPERKLSAVEAARAVGSLVPHVVKHRRQMQPGSPPESRNQLFRLFLAFSDALNVAEWTHFHANPGTTKASEERLEPVGGFEHSIYRLQIGRSAIELHRRDGKNHQREHHTFICLEIQDQSDNLQG